MIELLVAILACWRITAFLTYEKTGAWVREAANAHMLGDDDQPVTTWGRIITCFWCMSLIPAGALGAWVWVHSNWSWIYAPMVALAVSGGAILLNEYCGIRRYAERR
jgi:hypothetical protein